MKAMVIFAMFGLVPATMTLSAPARAASPGQVAVSPEACPPDTVITVAGNGFPALSFGTVTLDHIDLGQISTDETGAFIARFMVPETSSGPAKIRVMVGKTRGSVSFTVLAAGSPHSCPTTS